MTDPFDRHALVKIVGIDADPQQSVHQPGQSLDRIIDAAQQHRLIVDDHPGTTQPQDPQSRLRVNSLA